MKIVIKIEGMSCQHCVKRVDAALKENFDASEVVVDLENNQATLTTTQAIDDQKIVEVLDDVGYDVVAISRS